MKKEIPILIYPARVFVCNTQKSFNKIFKNLGEPKEDLFIVGGVATTWSLKNNVFIICFDRDRFKKITVCQQIGLAAHEATHVMQRLSDAIGMNQILETEACAYLVQYIVMHCIDGGFIEGFNNGN